MAAFGAKSEARLLTLHPDIQRVLRRAILIMDFSILCGLRNKQDQEHAVVNGYSNAPYPKSGHNCSLQDDGSYDFKMSDAVDVAPWPIKWPDIGKQTSKEYTRRMGLFYKLAGVIETCAAIEDVKLKWGGDFKNIFDGPHFERVCD
jgi:hypothetical protein